MLWRDFCRWGEHAQVVLRLDDQAPASPDETCAGQGKVLRKGELLNGTGKVGNAGNDEAPLYKAHVVSFIPFSQLCVVVALFQSPSKQQHIWMDRFARTERANGTRWIVNNVLS